MVKFEELESDVDALEINELISSVSFCEKYNCEELRLLIYTNVIVHNLRINKQELFLYLQNKEVA